MYIHRLRCFAISVCRRFLAFGGCRPPSVEMPPGAFETKSEPAKGPPTTHTLVYGSWSMDEGPMSHGSFCVPISQYRDIAASEPIFAGNGTAGPEPASPSVGPTPASKTMFGKMKPDDTISGWQGMAAKPVEVQVQAGIHKPHLTVPNHTLKDATPAGVREVVFRPLLDPMLPTRCLAHWVATIGFALHARVHVFRKNG